MPVNDSPPSPSSPLPPPWWHWINWLALDAVAVALAWLAVFGGMTGTRLTAVNYVALGAAVWLIYMTDRLTDSWTRVARAGRHRFAGMAASRLVPVMFAVAGVAVWIVCYGMPWFSAGEGTSPWMKLQGLRLITFKAGILMILAVGIYFLMVLGSRVKRLSQPMLLMVGLMMLLGLVPREISGLAGVQLWFAMAIVTLLRMLFLSVRIQHDGPPWIFLKKGLGGYLFAVGVAIAPFSHLQDWEDLLNGAPVLLFAGTCTLNSLGIRLWESPDAGDPEILLLQRLYPWLLAALGSAALLEAWGADAWSRPVLLGIAFSAAGLGVIHLGHKRWPVMACGLAADGLLGLTGLAVWQMGLAAHSQSN